MSKLIVHHLMRSQSERTVRGELRFLHTCSDFRTQVWLLEELGVKYDLVLHQRNSHNFLSPPELVKMHETTAAPVLQDGNVTLAESGAINEYILMKHNPDGKLLVKVVAFDRGNAF